MKTYCCSLSCLCIFVKNQLFMYVCVCVCVCLSSLAILFSLSIPFFMPVPHCIDYCGFLINFPKKAMAPHSSTLAWKIPWTEEPGRLQSMGSLRVGHDWATSLWLFTFMHWRRKWQPTPVFLPGESQGWGSKSGSVISSNLFFFSRMFWLFSVISMYM